MERDRVPVFQNAPAVSVEAARAMPVGQLRMSVCETCSFIANDAFEPALVNYGADYQNDQSCSPAFDAHIDSLIEGLLKGGVVGKRILEVGCGTGSFLKRLCRAGNNSGVGYDPAYAGGETSALTGSVRCFQEYYRGQSEGQDAEIVISRHVIEHVPNPLQFLKTAVGGIGPRRIFIETPAVEWILRRNVVQDVFYEHCSYFSEQSLRFVAQSAGLRVERLAVVFGGQYLWMEAEAGQVLPQRGAGPDGSTIAADARSYGRTCTERLTHLRDEVREMQASGEVGLWGAGAKGVTLANLLDPERKLINCLIDVNPAKQGRFVPGTGHPIVAPREIARLQIRHAVIMNPNYAAEITSEARRSFAGIHLHVCDEL